MPFHKGHEYLIDFSKNFMSSLDKQGIVTVLVCYQDEEPIPGKERYKWLNEHYKKDAHVKIMPFWNMLPNYPEDDVNFWDKWKYALECTISNLKEDSNQEVKYLFASESYGKKLAEVLGLEFIPVERDTINISGTEIRNNPYKHWEYLTPEAKRFYTHGICITGPESVGKTTLVKNLTNIFSTVSTPVPEYGRVYMEKKEMKTWNTNDIKNIMRGHYNLMNMAFNRGTPLVISDTDLFVTKLYAEMVGKSPQGLNQLIQETKNLFSHYLVLTPEVDWFEDSIRTKEMMADRELFFDKIIRHMKQNKYSYTVISGKNYTQRTEDAILDVNNFILNKGIH